MEDLKKIQWTQKKVSNFWNFIENSEAHREEYFSKFYGKNIINFLNYLVNFEGEILDYGCGSGYLIEEMLKRNISCQACDFSESAIEFVNKKFRNEKLWKQAKQIQDSHLPYDNDSIDLIICVETIEHILDDSITNTLLEFHRVLKPNTGKLFITTPNNEDLNKGLICCPECRTLFHYYQHVRAFNTSTLGEFMEIHGFQTELCNSTNFDLFKPYMFPHYLDWSLRQWRYIIGRILINSIDYFKLQKSMLGIFLFRRRLNSCYPHLFWIGSKH